MAASDRFAGMYGGAPDMTWPIERASTPSKSDTVDLANVTRAIFIGGAGDVKVDLLAGDGTRSSGVTVTALAVGMWHPMRVARVYTTGTTATAILVGE